MKTKTEKVYHCEFCNKHSIYKHVISLHERQCKLNPKNKHKCFEYCQYLEKSWDENKEEINFFCNITDIEMYSYKLERYHKAFEERMKNLTRMPLKCNFYEIQNGHPDYKPK